MLAGQIDILGYAALTINLTSMAMKRVLWLRSLSALANSMYVIYGLILGAMPIVIGCSIAVALHVYHIQKMIGHNKRSVVGK